MTGFRKVLVDSFRMLYRRPKIFAPKIVSMAMSSTLLILFLSSRIDYFTMLVLLPILGMVGLFASVMVAYMVKEEGQDNILKNSFYAALSRWKPAAAVSIVILVIGFVTAIPLTFALFYYAETGSVLAVTVGVVIAVAAVLLAGFASYFLPITLLEENSLKGSILDSFRTSRENSKEVTLLLLVSLILLGVAFASDSYLQVLGYAGFIVGRVISTVVNTYLFVVSPTFYLEN
ncbi:MAG: hypothetical protein ABEJ99_00630 [Candidatus Nanohaloarchaea archaeon]